MSKHSLSTTAGSDRWGRERLRARCSTSVRPATPSLADRNQIDVISNDEAGTVTFIADYPEDSIVAPTEWITVDAETLVDTKEHR